MAKALNVDRHYIVVRSIYSKAERKDIRDWHKARMKTLDVGVPRFHKEILRQVSANNQRIEKYDGSIGLHVDQLSVKNLYHFFDGRRSDDARVQILDAYKQITEPYADAAQ